MTDQSRRVPADRGLSGLGLIMQLFGTVFAAATALYGTMFVVEYSRTSPFENRDSGILLWVLLLAGTGIVRSLVHRSAGESILYGHEPFAKIRTYLMASGANAASWLYVVAVKGSMPSFVWLPLMCVLMAWPIALTVIVGLPGIRDMAHQVPHGEDHGFEGVSLLMLIFGLFWLILTALGLYALWEGTPKEIHNSGPFMLVIISLLVLIIRAGLHINAGLHGLRTTQLDGAVQSANRYADFGVVAAFVTGGCLLLAIMMTALDMTAFVFISCIVWMLLAWPMIIRRFFNERQFAEIMAAPDGNIEHHRAPDLGLTTLGWFLLAVALVTLSYSLPSQLLSPAGYGAEGVRQMKEMFPMMSLLNPAIGHSPWWGIGLGALQLWAGIELVRMSDLHRVAATAFGAITTAANLYFFWPVLSHLGELRHGGLLNSTTVLASLALELIIPLTTIFAANRSVVPSATARVRA